jgi:hypothetical protein
MHGDIGDAAQGLVALFHPAEIEGATHPQAPHHGDVIFGEAAEMIGAEDLPPAHNTAIACGVATEVAEIAGADEAQIAGREFGHRIG